VTAPTVYNYNQTTGLYLGSSQARQSPLDIPGTWLYPANSTLIAPPTAGPGQAAYFSATLGTWGLSSATPPPDQPPPGGVPSCMLWQLEAILTPEQWSQVQSAVAAMNNPAVTAFAAHGSNFIPANSTTLIQLGAAIGFTPDQVKALVEKASGVVIP
jgi:hypothetical protein